MPNTHLLLATGRNGQVAYYTGRAGDGWLSPQRADAFTYGAGEAARVAERMSRMAPVHGWMFAATPA